MKNLLVILLMVLSTASFGQITINSYDKNGVRTNTEYIEANFAYTASDDKVKEVNYYYTNKSKHTDYYDIIDSYKTKDGYEYKLYHKTYGIVYLTIFTGIHGLTFTFPDGSYNIFTGGGLEY